jgi:hypothetical protein
MRPSTPKNGRGSRSAARHAGLRSPPAPPTPASTPAEAKRGSVRNLPNRQSPSHMQATVETQSFLVLNGPDRAQSRGVQPGRFAEASPQPSSTESDDDLPQISQRSPSPTPLPRPSRIVFSTSTLVIEELSDFDGSDIDRLGVIRPHQIEDAESDRSRSRSRNPPEAEGLIINGLDNLRCSDEGEGIEDSEESDMDEAEHEEVVARMRRDRRRKRQSTGSIGKRTITESLGSDSDREDLRTTTPFLDITEVGSSARRMKRRVGDRWSLQFHDPPLPVIQQMEEPPTSDDDLEDAEALAKELPYHQYHSMEIDSS